MMYFFLSQILDKPVQPLKTVSYRFPQVFHRDLKKCGQIFML